MGLWRKHLSRVVSAGSVMRTAVLRNRLKRQHTQGSSVVTEADAAERAKLAYWEQGDESMYTPEMLQQRAALREHRAVQQILQVWWHTALQVSPSRASESDSQTLSRTAYLTMLAKIYKVMIEEGEYSAAEALECAAEDYERASPCGERTRPTARWLAALVVGCIGWRRLPRGASRHAVCRPMRAVRLGRAQATCRGSRR
jgi:hypothetical protein